MKNIFVKQHDTTECAAACLAMICLFYNKETTITKLRDMMGTDLKGTNLLGLTFCAEKLGFSAQAIRVDKEGFFSKYTLPCIAHINTKEGLSHFVVIFKIGPKYIILGDPAKDLVKISIDDFYKGFTGALLLLTPNETFTMGKTKDKNIFFRFSGFLLAQKKLFAYSILASVILTILGIVSSMFNKILMDEILPFKLKNTLTIVLIVFTLVAVTQTIIGFLRQWIMLYLSQKIDIPLFLGYFKHIYSLPMRFFATRKTGDILTRFSDAFTIKNIFTNIALTLIMDIVMAVVTGLILLQMNPELFSVIGVMSCISIALVFVFRQPYKKTNEEQMQQSAALNSQIIEGLRAVETIKGNAAENMELENIEKEYIRSLRIGLKEGMLSNVQGSISGMVSTIGNLVMMYVGIMQVINGNITLGSMMAFSTLSGYFMNPVGSLVGLQLQIQEAGISMKRIAEILDHDVEQSIESTFKEIEKISGDIDFTNITFRYGTRKPVLEDVSFTIPYGKKVALVGASGSGKSTIAKLLLKYYTPEKGEISVDGIDISEIDFSSLRKAISYVPQSIELFSRSIFDNIRVAKQDASLEDVKEAAGLADAHDFIKKQPMQYLSFLQEAGGGLSTGEKQRIALARAFLKKSNLFILDESTSSLDFATENVVFNTIYGKFKNKSMLIIAHRLATVRNCDNIIVLEDGKILEQGMHEELLKKQGKYYCLWQMQQGNIESLDRTKHIPEPVQQERSLFPSPMPTGDEMTYT